MLAGQTTGNLRIYAYAQQRSEQIIGATYLHPSGTIGPFKFDYLVQAIPVYLLHQPKLYDYESDALTTKRSVTYGAAILPVGERMVLNPHQRLQCSLYSSGGFLYFTRRVLSEGATRLNFNVQFGSEFEYRVSDRHSVIVGYAIHHFSNGNIHLKNPGLDANLLFVNYTFLVRPAHHKQ